MDELDLGLYARVCVTKKLGTGTSTAVQSKYGPQWHDVKVIYYAVIQPLSYIYVHACKLVCMTGVKIYAFFMFL